jgi:hypothetical protein
MFGLSKVRQTASKSVAPVANAKLGINLAGIEYWGTEFPFLDLFKQSRAWFVEGQEPENSGLHLDAKGWVKQLVEGQVASTIISSIDNSHFPAGDYVVLYEGEGEITIPNYAVKSAKTGRLVVHIDGQKGLFRLDITKTNPQNYIKNIRVVAKAHVNNHQKNPWNPAFLKRWSGVACLRFMDFMRTNNSPITTWESRAKPTDVSFVSNGVPMEWMVDLANRLNCDAWFCMPHQADDNYVRQFAQYVAQHLKPRLKAWVENSNEVWNGAFEQHHYAKQAGLDLNLTKNDWASAAKFNAYRSMQIFSFWEAAFGSNDRLVRVLASQAAYAEVAKQILNFKLPNNKKAADYADVLAIANYVHLSISPMIEHGLNSEKVSAWPLEKLFDYLDRQVLPESEAWLRENKKIADEYGLKLVAYEAGQHLVGVGEAVNNKKLTQLFVRANADARMGQVYAKSLAAWHRIGGDLICSFNSVSGWSQWGSWGLLQYQDDRSTPKFKATIDWAKSRGQKMSY